MNKQLIQNYQVFRNSIFYDDFKRIFFKVICLWGFFAIFEGAGISLLYPIVEYLDSGYLNKENLVIKTLDSVLNHFSLSVSVTKVFIFSIIVIFLRFYFLYAKGRLIAFSLHEIEVKFRDLLVHNLYNSNMSYFIKKEYGEWISTFSTDVIRARSIINDASSILGNLFLLLIYSFVLILISLDLTIFCLPIFLLSIIILRKRGKFYEDIGQTISKNSNDYFKIQEDSMKNIIFLKMSNLIGFVEKKLSIDNKLLGNNQFLLSKQNLKIDFYFSWIVVTSIIYIIVIGKFYLTLNFLKLAIFLYILNRSVPCLQLMVRAVLDFLSNSQSLRKIIDLNLEAATNKETAKGKKRLKNKIKKISLNNITFKYPGTFNNVLENISIDVMSGESIGIIGNSGSGKSTLLNIITGFYKKNNGLIEINKQDFDGLLISDYRKKVSYLPQNPELFNCSILDNFTFGRKKEEINIREIEVILRKCFCDFIFDLPLKLDEVVGDRGLGLSGGQRQRIVIARAIYNKSDVFILDEATNGLDDYTEEQIIKVLSSIKNKTIQIISSHKISTIANTDKLVYLKNGKIVNYGKTKLLLKNKSINNFFNKN
tara:strand:- start:549 stop:2333 length:1785 start_codon:yes stop_codon:yes gene_type:complete